MEYKVTVFHPLLLVRRQLLFLPPASVRNLCHALEHRHIVNRRVHTDTASALKDFVRGGQLPLSGGEIDLALPLVQVQDRRHEEPITEHILIFRLPALFILRKLVEHGAQQRGAVLVRFLIQLFDMA